MAWYGGWAPYVPVAERRRKAAKQMARLRAKGVDIQPVTIEGRKIARTFWGEAWCDHLESFSDFENRLPRGRTYVRNGSVCHMAISKGKIEAKVSGSDIYDLRIRIQPLNSSKWKSIKRRCTGQIASLVELLQGRLSSSVMEVVTNRQNGLFPLPDEIDFDCDCPDWAYMCKHVAAVLYGVGTRLDTQPELLFKLRGVNHEELIEADAAIRVGNGKKTGGSKRLQDDELSDVFGIDLDLTETAAAAPPKTRPTSRKKSTKRPKKRTTARTQAKSTASSAKKTPAAKKKKAVGKKKTGTKAAGTKKKTTSKRSTKKTMAKKRTTVRKKK